MAALTEDSKKSSVLGDRQAQAPACAGGGKLDPLRHTPLRFLAFANEVGEALHPFLDSRTYHASYTVVFAYGLADTALKACEAWQRASRAALGAAAPRRKLARGVAPAASLSLAGAGRAVAGAGRAAFRAAQPRERPQPGRRTGSGSSGSSNASNSKTGRGSGGNAQRQQQRGLVTPATAACAAAACAAAADALLFHALASVAIPGAIVNRAVWAAGRGAAAARLPPLVQRYGPTALGIGLIPLLVRHVDGGVEAWMDAAVRPHWPPHALPPHGTH